MNENIYASLVSARKYLEEKFPEKAGIDPDRWDFYRAIKVTY